MLCLNDSELVREVIHGNIECFTILMSTYEQGIMRFIYNIVKNQEASEDLSQEVFIAAYYKLHTYKSEYKFSTWLYTIANNKCLDYLRRSKKIYEVNVETAPLISREISPEQMLEYKETKEGVEKFIMSLKEVDKKILALRSSQDNLTYNDIAQILNTSPSNVKKRYYKVIEAYERFKEDAEKTHIKGVI